MRYFFVVLASVSAVTACIYPRSGESEIHWTYDGLNGPLQWHSLSTDYEKCGAGLHQSPININSTSIPLLNAADLRYPHRGDFNLTHNGHAIEAVPLSDYHAVLSGEQYKLINFHFHASSEHRLNGVGYPVEAHFVHTHVKTGALAVVGVFIDIGSGRDASFFRNIPFELLENKGEAVVVKGVNLRTITRSAKRVFAYSGSLTVPPCTEQVSWFMADTPIIISTARYRQLRKALRFNARFTQGVPGEANVLRAG